MKCITKRLFVTLLAVCLTAALFAGCAAAADGNVSITVLCGFASEDPHGQYIYQYAEAFMAQNPNVSVEVQAISTNDIYTRLAAMATSPATIPTLFFTAADQVATLYDLGITANMQDYLADSVINGFAHGVVEASSIDGNMTYYPVSVQPLAILYRTDLFEAAGLSVPTNWDELVECAIALTNNEDGEEHWGFGMVGSNNSSGQSRFLAYLWSNGFRIIYEEDGVWKTDISMDDDFMTAFSRWTDMNNVHQVVPIGITGVDYATAANYFAMGYTSTMMSGSNALGVTYANNPGLRGNIGSFMIPGDYPGTMLNAEGYAMSAHASEAQKEAAVAFLEFFTTHDDEMMFWHVSGKIPSTLEGQKVEYITGPDYQGYIDQINAGCLPIIAFPGVSAFRSALGNAYSVVFSGEATNEQAVQSLIAAVEEILRDYN